MVHVSLQFSQKQRIPRYRRWFSIHRLWQRSGPGRPLDSQGRNRHTRFPEVWFYDAIKNLLIQPEPSKVGQRPAEIYSRAKPMGSSTFSLGDVLASARHAYGSPWLPALQIPRRSDDVFIFFAAGGNGLACSFYALPAGRSGHNGLYVGEPRLYVGKSTYRGITEDCWNAFSKNKVTTKSGVYGGELSTMEAAL